MLAAAYGAETPTGYGLVNHSEIVSFLWGVADLIRDTFKRGKYQDVSLPLTVLRRLDCVLADTKRTSCWPETSRKFAPSRQSAPSMTLAVAPGAAVWPGSTRAS